MADQGTAIVAIASQKKLCPVDVHLVQIKVVFFFSNLQIINIY